MWSFCTKNGLGKLYKVSNKFNSIDYCNILDEALPEIDQLNNDFIFLQDNASIHRSKYTTDYLNNELMIFDVDLLKYCNKTNILDRKINILNNYPAKSPDLNLMENFWGILQMRYNKLVLEVGQPKNETKLFKMANNIWEEMRKDKELVKRMYDSYLQRFRKVIFNNGNIIKY